MTILDESDGEQGSPVELLGAAARRIADVREIGDVLNEAIVFVMALLNCDACTVYLVENDDLVLGAASPSFISHVIRVPRDTGRGSRSWKQSQTVTISKLAYQDARCKLFYDGSKACFESFMSVPMINRSRQTGTINAFSHAARKYSKRQLDIISILTCLTASRIESIRLQIENADLALRLESCDDIEGATKILRSDLGLTQEEAYLLLQRESRQRRKPMRELAAAIVLGNRLKNSSNLDPKNPGIAPQDSESLSTPSEL